MASWIFGALRHQPHAVVAGGLSIAILVEAVRSGTSLNIRGPPHTQERRFHLIPHSHPLLLADE